MISEKEYSVKLAEAQASFVAKYGGMQVLGISCVTNMAAGILGQKLSHVDVLETAGRIEKQFVHFVQG